MVPFRRTDLRGRDLAADLWRPVLATGEMAGALFTADLMQTPSEQSGVWTGLSLATAVLLGVLMYGVVTAVAWLAAARPRGAEPQVLAMVDPPVLQRFGR
jgi:hypothetical protein